MSAPVPATMPPQIQRIRSLVRRHTTVAHSSIHGPTHWARVEANGLKIAQAIGADPTVITLFALFHDSMRLDDGYDPDHGPRAAAFIRQFADELDFLTEVQLDQLCRACEGHTRERHNPDPTIGACYDADRLDLGRVGLRPNPQYMNSEFTRAWARRLR